MARHGRTDLGWTAQAKEKEAKLYATLAGLEAHGRLDLTQRPEHERRQRRAYIVKGQWVLYELETKYGQDFLKRYVVALRKYILEHRDKDDAARINRMSMSDLIRLFSQAAGEDLTKWFQSIGTIINP